VIVLGQCARGHRRWRVDELRLLSVAIDPQIGLHEELLPIWDVRVPPHLRKAFGEQHIDGGVVVPLVHVRLADPLVVLPACQRRLVLHVELPPRRIVRILPHRD